MQRFEDCTGNYEPWTVNGKGMTPSDLPSSVAYKLDDGGKYLCLETCRLKTIDPKTKTLTGVEYDKKVVYAMGGDWGLYHKFNRWFNGKENDHTCTMLPDDVYRELQQ